MLAGIIAAVSNNDLGIAGLGGIPIAPGGPAAPVDIAVINPLAIKCNDARTGRRRPWRRPAWSTLS